MLGLAAVLICLLLLFTPTSTTKTRYDGGSSYNTAINNRLTISLVVGAVGVAVLYGSS